MHGGSRLPARHRRGGVSWPTAMAVLVILAVIGGGSYLMLARASPAPPASASAPPASGPTRPAAVPAARVAPAATVTITWVGDMTFGMLNAWPPDGTGSLLDNVRPYLHSNLTVGNLESVLGDLPVTKCSPGETDCFQFEAPAATAVDLQHDGFAAVNVANNHTMDAGVPGETSTDAALRAAGLLWAGRPGQITYLTRNGIKIALLGFAPWSYDADALDIPAAQALVRTARQHAQLVIVMEHLGGEGPTYRHVKPGEEYFLGQDRGNSIAFTHAMIDAGADLVMGSGPHVLRGMQWYHHHLIAYSLGNFSGYNTLGLDSYTSVSGILHVTLTAAGAFVRGSITPLRLVAPGIPERDPAGQAISFVNTLSQEDFGGNGAVRLTAAGRIEKPAS
jgi:poly-gamma-glutamate capsule biosynthesis protein CapA/YwtB (metallophosphatase superfamily)